MDSNGKASEGFRGVLMMQPTSMEPTLFSAALLRTSSQGFASVAAGRVVERALEELQLSLPFGEWKAHLYVMTQELAAAVSDASLVQFANKWIWIRDSHSAREMDPRLLPMALEELQAVLKDALAPNAWEPLPPYFAAAAQALEEHAQAPEQDSQGELQLGIAQELLLRIRDAKSDEGMDLVVEAVRKQELSLSDALDQVLVPCLRRFGSLWYAGEVGVAEEHYATLTLGRLLERLLFIAPRKASNGRSVVLSTVDGDTHDITLRITAAHFELEGWRTLCLGASTPAEDLAGFCVRHQSDLFILAASLNPQRHAVTKTLETLRKALPSQKILIGGGAFEGLESRAKALGADGYCESPQSAIAQARQLFQL